MTRIAAAVAIAAALVSPAGPAAAQTPAAAQAPAKPVPPSADEARDANLAAYVELLRSDVRAQKVAILTQLMELTDEQDAVFWPIYREYDVELSKLGDERIAMLREYGGNYGSMTDALAESLAKRAIDIDRRRAGLLASYHERVSKALSPTAALRFLQVEHQLLLILDLQISAMLPVAK